MAQQQTNNTNWPTMVPHQHQHQPHQHQHQQLQQLQQPHGSNSYGQQHAAHHQHHQHQQAYGGGQQPPQSQHQMPYFVNPSSLQQSKDVVQAHFKSMLDMLNSFDDFNGNTAQQISHFTQHYHSLAAREITDVIKDFITSRQERQFIYLYVMDNIMKNVQGDYILYFEQQLRFVIGLVLQRCQQNQEDQKRLFKLVKSWEVLGLFNRQILDEIAIQHNLRTLEAQLSPEEHKKILLLKEQHEPDHLPYELLRDNRFICGTQVNRQDFQRKTLANMARMFGQPNPNATANTNTYWQQQQQYPQQLSYGNYMRPSATGGANNGQQPQAQQQPQQSAMELLAQLVNSGNTANTASNGPSHSQQNPANPSGNPANTANPAQTSNLGAPTTTTTTDERERNSGNEPGSRAGQQPVGGGTAAQMAATGSVAAGYGIVNQPATVGTRPPAQQHQQFGGGTQAPSVVGSTAAGQAGPASNRATAGFSNMHQTTNNLHSNVQQQPQQSSGTQSQGHHFGTTNHHMSNTNNVVNYHQSHHNLQHQNQHHQSTTATHSHSHTHNVVQSNQKSVGFRQFGFLPSLLKSFSSFNKTQQLSLGNFIFHQATDSHIKQTTSTSVGNTSNGKMGVPPPHPQCPTFSNKESLTNPSEAAQCEIFSGIKFYCALCGMRFVRNVALKEHLNAHFEANLALKKRGDRTMARDQYQGFADFVAPRKHVIKQDGEAAGGQSSLSAKDVVLYDGAKSHISQYNFCYLCKERLDTYHDEVDENWYFVDTKQVRFKQTMANSAAESGLAVGTPAGVFNVHTNCLKEIEEINVDDMQQVSAATAQWRRQSPKLMMESNGGQQHNSGHKRTYIDATAGTGTESQDVPANKQRNNQLFKGLQDIIQGFQSQKRQRRV